MNYSSTLHLTSNRLSKFDRVRPGTYYFRFQSLNAETVSGMFKLRWEERP